MKYTDIIYPGAVYGREPGIFEVIIYFLLLIRRPEMINRDLVVLTFIFGTGSKRKRKGCEGMKRGGLAQAKGLFARGLQFMVPFKIVPVI
jgi:hypothetical protein